MDSRARASFRMTYCNVKSPILNIAVPLNRYA
jgi:hypothetical protein